MSKEMCFVFNSTSQSKPDEHPPVVLTPWPLEEVTRKGVLSGAVCNTRRHALADAPERCVAHRLSPEDMDRAEEQVLNALLMIGRWAELLHGQLGMQAKRQLLIPPEEIEILVKACKARSVIHAAVETQRQAFREFGRELEKGDRRLYKLEQEVLMKLADFEPFTQEEASLIKNLSGISQLQLLAIGTVQMDLDKLKSELVYLNIDKLIERWEAALPGPDPPRYPPDEYYIRLDGMSPKDGIRGNGPHSSVRSMLVSIASSDRATAYLNRYAPAPEEPEAVKPAKKGKKKKKEPEAPKELQVFYTKFPGMLWMFPYDRRREEAWEFRCFVYGQQLRAISQRVWNRDLRGEGVKWAQAAVVEVWANAITKAACRLVKRLCFGEPKPQLEADVMMTSFQRARRDTEIAKLAAEEESILPEHFTLDVLVRDNKMHGMPAPGTKHENMAVAECEATLEATQVKPFGSQFDVGSATYHWVNDYKTLVHGMKNGKAIEFRFIADVEPMKGSDYEYTLGNTPTLTFT